MSAPTPQQRLERIAEIIPRMRRADARMRGTEGQVYRDAGTQEFVALSDQLFALASSLEEDGSLKMITDCFKAPEAADPTLV